MDITDMRRDGENEAPHQKIQATWIWITTAFVRMWSCLHLDTAMLMKMLKGGLPPVIVVSLFQASAIADYELTTGYLSATIAIGAQCLQPRGKFMKIAWFTLLSICSGAALACLVILCSVSARQHTTPGNAVHSVKEGYNSSASAVSGIWLLLSIWVANIFRALRPVEFQSPMVAFSLFSIVTMTTTPSFITISEGLVFVRRLLGTFLIGLGVATGVSLFVLPTTSRGNLFELLNTYPDSVDRLFTAQIAYVREGETPDQGNGTSKVESTSTEEAIMSTLSSLQDLHSRLGVELSYAKLEIAWGKLLPEDLDSLYRHLRSLELPLTVLSLLPEISQGLLHHIPEWSALAATCEVNGQGSASPAEGMVWKILRTDLHQRLAQTACLVTGGLKTALELLEIQTPSSMTTRMRRMLSDLEEQDTDSNRGSSATSQDFHQQLQEYRKRSINLYEAWSSLMLSPGVETNTHTAPGHDSANYLSVFLFMEHVQNEIVHAVQGLLTFAKARVSSGDIRQNKFIIPNYHQLNWVQKRSHDVAGLSTSDSILMNDAEHLPPSTLIERMGNYLRFISRFLDSSESRFGFRVSLAAFTVAILAYLRQTQKFFNDQHLLWAMIVLVIGMKPESGASVYAYLGRSIGTIVAVVLSLLVWYIVDGHTVGVLIFLYLANMFECYIGLRFPQLVSSCTVSSIALNIVVAYQLQVKKLGIERATATGQPYYEPYEFGPLRLLCVLAGITVAFFWTIFPYPVSERTQVRKAVAKGLFLLARSYSCMHTSIKVWIHKKQGDTNDPASPGRHLQASSNYMFWEQTTLSASTRSEIHWTGYEIPIGGKFPKSTYLSAVSNMQTIATCIALISHTTHSRDSSLSMSNIETLELQRTDLDGSWIHHLVRASGSLDLDSHAVTSLLCNLGGAISSMSALPPYLPLPEPFPLSRKLRGYNSDALRVENIQDPMFLTFSCTDVIMSLVNSRLEALIKDVQDLVGKIDFDSYVDFGNEGREKLL